MPIYERLSMVVSLILIGLALYFVIDLPARAFDFDIFGVSLAFTISHRSLMVVLLGGLAFTGSGAIIRAHPYKKTPYTIPFWGNPTLLVVLVTLFLTQLETTQSWVIGLFITGILLWFTILAEYHLVSPSDTSFNISQLWSQGISYALILAMTILIYQAQLPGLLKAILIFWIGWTLASSIFRLHRETSDQAGPFEFLVGLGVGQIAWVLTYWHISPLAGGLLILLLFYGLCGLINARLEQKFSQQVVIEYATVAGMGLILIRWLGIF